jgi:hypothetical protein
MSLARKFVGDGSAALLAIDEGGLMGTTTAHDVGVHHKNKEPAVRSLTSTHTQLQQPQRAVRMAGVSDARFSTKSYCNVCLSVRNEMLIAHSLTRVLFAQQQDGRKGLTKYNLFDRDWLIDELHSKIRAASPGRRT